MEPQAKKILEQIKSACMTVFSENLVGVYVHGSLAFGCFNWSKSDIDFIVVVQSPPTQEQKEEYVKRLLRIDRECPPKGLEMSIVLEQYCSKFLYPTPFELHFSNYHKQDCCADISEYCARMNGTDQDLAAHFAVVKAVGITLCGKNVDDVFESVPKQDYMDSIKFDIEDARKDILENPMYVILNLCRAHAYQKEDQVLSKKQGAEWCLRQIPAKYIPVIQAARDSYCSEAPFPSEIANELLCDFADYMLIQIFGAM